MYINVYEFDADCVICGKSKILKKKKRACDNDALAGVHPSVYRSQRFRKNSEVYGNQSFGTRTDRRWNPLVGGNSFFFFWFYRPRARKTIRVRFETNRRQLSRESVYRCDPVVDDHGYPKPLPDRVSSAQDVYDYVYVRRRLGIDAVRNSASPTDFVYNADLRYDDYYTQWNLDNSNFSIGRSTFS